MNSVEQFLASTSFAVAGASTRPDKFGNKIFRALLASGRSTSPLNPVEREIEGHPAYKSLGDLPAVPQALSIVTPPQVTRTVVTEAIALGVKHLWMQPGAQDAEASQAARAAGLTVIDDGTCILVELARASR